MQLTTPQLLADKHQLWTAQPSWRFTEALCLILKSYPDRVVVKFLSEPMETTIDRRCLVSQIKPGIGATKLSGSDLYPFTIIEVSKTGKRVNVQADTYIRTDKNGQSESQTYEYARKIDNPIITLLPRKNGTWHNKNAGTFILGERKAYQDPNF